MLKHFKSTQAQSIATKLTEIIRYGQITEFNCLLKEQLQPGDICTTIDSNGETPLNTTIQRNKMECLKKMLELDINLNSKNSKGFSPLHYALLYGHMKIACQFIERGAQTDEICRRKTGKTLLHKMISVNKPDAVRLLLENGASVNKCNKYGMTPLHVAVISSHKQMLNILLDFGADINQVNISNSTALHIAIQTNQPEISKILINNGANLLLKDEAESTLLYTSAAFGNAEICKQLLKQTRENLDTREILLGRSPLHTACANGFYTVVKVLLHYGANEKLVTKNHKAPLHLASEAGSADIVRLLRDKSISVDRKITHFKTPLLLAIDEGHSQVVQYIIFSKGDINTRGREGSTPLHYAAKKGKLQFVKLLVENGSDVNARNKRLRTPLHEAYIHGFEKVTAYLVDSGGNQHCMDEFQRTPIDYKSKIETKDVSDISTKYLFCINPILLTGVFVAKTTKNYRHRI